MTYYQQRPNPPVSPKQDKLIDELLTEKQVSPGLVDELIRQRSLNGFRSKQASAWITVLLGHINIPELQRPAVEVSGALLNEIHSRTPGSELDTTDLLNHFGV